jgi:hypothetical protein
MNNSLSVASVNLFVAGLSDELHRRSVSAVDGSMLVPFFAGLNRGLAELAATDATTGRRFNIFDYIRTDENGLSDILADLLNPRGNHSHGDLFLRQFLQVAGVVPSWPMVNVEATREAPTTYIPSCNRRMDILIHCPTGAVMVENKPSANDQEGQMDAYCDHLESRYGNNFIAMYLTDDGRPPTSLDSRRCAELTDAGRFRTLTYLGHIHPWLEQIMPMCKSDNLNSFIKEFDAYITGRFGVAS